MITEDEARRHVLQSVSPLAPRSVPLSLAMDRFAARDIFAGLALPLFDNSAMDGYAVVAGSCRRGQAQRVIGEQPAGPDRKLRIAPGEAIRIFTGAPMPEGADAVVMQEDVRREGSEIFIETGVEPGEFVRRRGSDVGEGQKIVEAGQRIRPQTLALLAAQGFDKVDVGGEVHAAIITTGDELVVPGESRSAGQIYESNSTLLEALFRKCGVSVAMMKHCPDEKSAMEAALESGLQQNVLVIVGGVSVGAHDLVRPALEAVGVHPDLWRVSVKPGKPFLFGRKAECAIFGLPGNPVSAFVTFLLFVRPALLRMMGGGEGELSLPACDGRLTEEMANRSDRPHYVRGRLVRGEFTPVGRQESHALYGLSQANGLLRVRPGEIFAAGTMVPILSLD